MLLPLPQRALREWSAEWGQVADTLKLSSMVGLAMKLYNLRFNIKLKRTRRKYEQHVATDK